MRKKNARQICLRLASKSLARRRLLRALLRSTFPQIRLKTRSVDVDERAVQRRFARSKKISSSTWTLAEAKKLALALARAKRVAAELGLPKVHRVGAKEIVLGCDQVVLAGGRILGKPGTHVRAKKMLKRFSGEKIYLVNGMSLSALGMATAGKTPKVHEDVQVIEMSFAKLSSNEIERVLRLDRPYGAAGSFHFEDHGANLLKSVVCDDPTGIQGLSVMRLRSILMALTINA